MSRPKPDDGSGHSNSTSTAHTQNLLRHSTVLPRLPSTQDYLCRLAPNVIVWNRILKHIRKYANYGLIYLGVGIRRDWHCSQRTEE